MLLQVTLYEPKPLKPRVAIGDFHQAAGKPEGIPIPEVIYEDCIRHRAEDHQDDGQKLRNDNGGKLKMVDAGVVKLILLYARQTVWLRLRKVEEKLVCMARRPCC